MSAKTMKSNGLGMFGLTAAAVIVGAVTATAQEQLQAPAGDAARLQELQQGAQQLEARLNDISRRAEEENPELQARQEALEENYYAKLQEHGYPDEERLDELRAMQTALQDPDALEPDARDQLTREFQAEVTRMQEAQMHAQQDPEITAGIQALEDARMKAMSEIDAEARDLQERLENKIEQLQQIQQEMMQQQQPRQPAH